MWSAQPHSGRHDDNMPALGVCIYDTYGAIAYCGRTAQRRIPLSQHVVVALDGETRRMLICQSLVVLQLGHLSSGLLSRTRLLEDRLHGWPSPDLQ